MNNVLICLGMHRSGTSLISNWLHDCNLNIGDRLLGRNHTNKKGHFEDLDFHSLHEEILQYNNITPNGLIPPFQISINEYYYKKLISLINFKNSLHDQWGWKEPRTCLFVDHYKQIIPNAKYLILYRDYPFVVDSLMRRDLKDFTQWYNSLNIFTKIRRMKDIVNRKTKLTSLRNTYLSTWNIYNQNLLNLMYSLKKEDYIFTDYESLKEKDNEVFSKLINWGFKLDFKPFSSVFDSKLITEKLPDLSFDLALENEAINIKNKMFSR